MPAALLPLNLIMRLLIIKHLRILRFMGAMRAKRFRGSLILTSLDSRAVGICFGKGTLRRVEGEMGVCGGRRSSCLVAGRRDSRPFDRRLVLGFR